MDLVIILGLVISLSLLGKVITVVGKLFDITLWIAAGVIGGTAFITIVLWLAVNAISQLFH